MNSIAATSTYRTCRVIPARSAGEEGPNTGGRRSLSDRCPAADRSPEFVSRSLGGHIHQAETGNTLIFCWYILMVGAEIDVIDRIEN